MKPPSRTLKFRPKYNPGAFFWGWGFKFSIFVFSLGSWPPRFAIDSENHNNVEALPPPPADPPSPTPTRRGFPYYSDFP